MTEAFDWAFWFRELAVKIAEGGEDWLIQKAKLVDWGREPELLKHGDQGVDPFSFLYSLAQRNTTKQRPAIYPSVTKCFGLESPLPDPGNKDLYIFPTPIATAATCFHDSSHFGPKLLWKLFRQVVEQEPQVDPTTFREVLEIRYVAPVKLTHTLFLINPDYFVPADALQYVPANKGMDPRRCDHDGYMAAMDKAMQTFRECRASEINNFLFFQYMSKLPLLTAESQFFQVSTRAYDSDCWDDFDRSHAVYTDASRGGGAPGSWDEGTTGDDGRAAAYPLTEPRRGDVVLVRTGFRGRAIGIVHSNDYAEANGLSESSRLHVYWINKASADFSGAQTTQRAFTRVKPGSSSYKAFSTAALYEPTFALIDKARGISGKVPVDVPDPKPPPSIHALNTILYGPPGTGKTWHTVTRAVAVVDDREVGDVAQEVRPAVKRRFDEHRGAGRIEMVTFHQNTTYEDFVEGIRPVLTRGGDAPAEPESLGDVQYELSRGVFRRIAERAALDPNHRYVLVIDEINRGNIARIFGELITLIEESKRIGQDDEARVTLPGSKTDFGVPANLHVLGTMNTADRSIALLDTALRRRFVFEEMMPDPFHSGIRKDVDGIDCQKLLAAMNRRIAALLDREHQIGHTYFLRVDTLVALAGTFQNRIIPLLQEYFYDDWEKIRAVLNQNAFVRRSDPPEELIRLDLVDSSRAVYELLPARDGQWIAVAEYRKIYETKTPADDGGAAQGD